MSRKARWAVRIAMAAFGLLIATIFIALALHTASGLDVDVDGAARRARLLQVIGGLFKGIGLGSLFVAQAVGFREWTSWLRPLTPFSGLRGGLGGARRARRQIDGVEPYSPKDVSPLRLLAEYRASARRLNGPARAGTVSLIVFFIGAIIAPPDYPTDPASVTVFGQVFRVVAVVMTAVLVTACVVTWRTQTDTKAEAFLQRTAPGSMADGR